MGLASLIHYGGGSTLVEGARSSDPALFAKRLRESLWACATSVPVREDLRHVTAGWLIELGARAADDLFEAQLSMLRSALTDVVSALPFDSAAESGDYVQTVSFQYCRHEHRESLASVVVSRQNAKLAARSSLVAHAILYAPNAYCAEMCWDAIARNTAGERAQRFEALVELLIAVLVLLDRDNQSQSMQGDRHSPVRLQRVISKPTHNVGLNGTVSELSLHSAVGHGRSRK